MGSTPQDSLTEPHYDIKGIPLRGGKIPCRIECNDWCTKPEYSIQVSLFIRALQRMYDTPLADPLSFYQIASIHGYPGCEWNHGGAPPFHPPGPDTTFVYCTHNSSLFPTWHRPYMLLFEQRIHQLMLIAINQELVFASQDEKKTWKDEAYKWRLPYWDWGLPKTLGGIPKIFQTETIDIQQPNGKDGSPQAPLTRSNPLYRYECKDEAGKLTLMGNLVMPYALQDDRYVGAGEQALRWSACSGVSRWGITSATVPGKQAEGINNFLLTNQAITDHVYYKDSDNKLGLQSQTVSDLVYRLLDPGALPTWKAFSSTKYQTADKDITKWEQYINIEMIHNNLHNFIGGLNYKNGLGHMSDVPVAAFDPIFYFHHANVDYQFALWQKLNPKSEDPAAWFDASVTDATAETPLAPFWHKVDGQFKPWTSDACYETTDLNYDYDVLQKQDGESDEHLRQRIIASLDRYSVTDKILLQAAESKPEVLGIAGYQSMSAAEADQHIFPDYIASVLYDRYALDGAPYTIHFFFGQVDDETINKSPRGAEYLDNHIGYVHNFSASMQFDKPTCSNCARQTEEEALSTALVPLTIPLYMAAINANYGVGEIAPDEAEKFLKAALTWKVTNREGLVVPWDTKNLGRTKIMVLKGEARHYHQESSPSEFGLGGGYTPLHEVTDQPNKPCGATESDYEDPVASLFSQSGR